ncbi:exonuclease [Curtobacterium phage Parvaparticeps]|nr:exonuclease [Curtobacterium phage Parvaparticeps]
MTDTVAPAIVVSYSELDTYRQCPLKHLLAYKHRFRKPPEAFSALSKGSLWHEVLEHHYEAIRRDQAGRGGKPVPLRSEPKFLRELRAEILQELLTDDAGEQSETQALIEWMYDGYVEQYGTDRDWEILAVEHAAQFLLPTQQYSPVPVEIKMKLDLVVKDRKTGKVWIIDHKSGANLPSQMDLEIDDQFGLYTWGMTRHTKWKPVGSIHSAARTTRNQADFPDYAGKSKPQTLEQRMHRTFLNRTDQELENVANDAAAAAVNAYAAELEVAQLPVYSSPDPRQCGWKCDFKEAHLMARQGRPMDLALADQGFIQDFTRH